MAISTRLVHFGYREYDPFTGRFISPDPLGDTGGDHDLYDYCVDDPVSFVDATGLKETKVEEKGKEAKEWKDPNFLEEMFTFFLLPKEHPYSVGKREYANKVIGESCRTWGENMLGLKDTMPTGTMLSESLPEFERKAINYLTRYTRNKRLGGRDKE